MAKDYAALAKSKIRKPSQSTRMPRILVYGKNKKGKTRFGCTAPNVLVLDPEAGSDEEKKIDPDVWPIDRWEDVNDVYLFLKSGGVSPTTGKPYQWVFIDGATKIANYALRWVRSQSGDVSLDAKPSQIDKRQYGLAGEMMKGVLHNFHAMRQYGIIISAQERLEAIMDMDTTLGEDEDADPASYMYVPDLPKGARSAVNQVVDVIGRIYVVKGEFEKTVTRKGKQVTVPYTKQRRLWVGPDDMYDTGYRSAFTLPDMIADPTVASVVAAMREGKVAK